MRIIFVSGTPEEIGHQHGQQIADLRDRLVDTISTRLAAMRRLGADRPQQMQPIVAALQELDTPLLDYLRGLAASLELETDQLLRYTLSSYLRDLQEVADAPGPWPIPVDGCTAWAATAPHTDDGTTVLAKNRDYHRDHIPLQLLMQVTPAIGYRYLAVGSAGSPNVFSSGINDRGLAVADTHVLSKDLGPGLARYSLMRELLQHHADTASGLDYLRSVQQMGGGTIILADRHGHLAVWESGHEASGVVQRRQGFLVSTNHFVTEELASQWVENEPPELLGNSQARRARITDALSSAHRTVNPAWAVEVMSSHGSPLDAICRHPLATDGVAAFGTGDSSTISSVILLPAGVAPAFAGPALLLADGEPCQARWETQQLLQEGSQRMGSR